MKDQESIKIASQLISFKKKQREALRRAVAVARTYFFSERHRERVANSRAAAVVASSATKDDDNALIQVGSFDFGRSADRRRSCIRYDTVWYGMTSFLPGLSQ